ncbi:MAG: M20/M25/M40 family metallo-hydrolase [Solirubrobacterales bacterium]|nr:M20/M25/M40 family metallo-hydrolase [Solirubrobacterales bacterium]
MASDDSTASGRATAGPAAGAPAPAPARALAERGLSSVAAHRPEVEAAIEFVHAHPELAHEEEACARFLAGQLEHAGYAVERGIAGMQTAFRARLEGRPGGPAVGIVDLYDAVPAVRADGAVQAVHSCGHGPLAGGVAGAALAFADLRDELSGSVEVIGCPADELHAPGTRARGGGKALTAAAGIWDRLDAALYAHPEFNDTVTLRSRTMRRLVATVAGARTMDEAVEAPREAAARALEAAGGGRSDALMLESMTLDGDVEEGSGMALSATFFLTADSERALDALEADLRAGLAGASWTTARTVPGIVPDEGVRAAVAQAFAAAGRGFLADPPPLPFATDFGDISRRVPSALIGIGRPGGWEFHTDEGARQFASPAGVEAALATASVLALSVVELLGEA